MSTLIVGDIHGCYDEFQTLLDQAGLGDADTLIAVGDLLDRGPKPREVFTFFHEHANALSVRGNHEDKHLRYQRGEKMPPLTQLVTRWKLNELYAAAVNYFASLPTYIACETYVIAHGYYEPGVRLEEQREEVLVGLDEGEAHLMATLDQPWFQAYDGERPIITGHRDYSNMHLPLIIPERVYAIDTGCVYGGALTGILLPEWRVLRVPARENWYALMKDQHGA